MVWLLSKCNLDVSHGRKYEILSGDRTQYSGAIVFMRHGCQLSHHVELHNERSMQVQCHCVSPDAFDVNPEHSLFNVFNLMSVLSVVD